MTRLQLKYWPFLFDSVTIDEKVEPNKIGNFVLGYAKELTGGFVPKYAGRSVAIDSDLKKELRGKLQVTSKSRQLFKFDYAQLRKSLRRNVSIITTSGSNWIMICTRGDLKAANISVRFKTAMN